MLPKSRSWNEIRRASNAFVAAWKDETSEAAEKQTFWNEFFAVFGITRRNFVRFEKAVEKLGGAKGFIDAFWPGEVIVEHKSRGEDLSMARVQALDYLNGVPQHELPAQLVVSDFANFYVLDFETGAETEFPLGELPRHVELFARFAGYRKRGFVREDEVSVEAARLMGRLHDQLRASGYTGHPLRVMLERLMFLLFADDTGLLGEQRAFLNFMEDRTVDDGSDLGGQLALLFQILDTPEDQRQATLDEALAAMPYVNGKVFAETIPVASFDRQMRETFIESAHFDWSQISPAIFGSMFQSVMQPDERHDIGGHYTTEENILKALRPLFLDDLEDAFARCRTSHDLQKLHNRLAGINVLDPACGCGNFLIVAYRELRRLELKILRRTQELAKDDQMSLDVTIASRIKLEQFHGIEIEEFPARIAEGAMYLIDHLANLELSEAFGEYYARIPLEGSANIRIANALDLDWSTVVSKSDCTYIVGNPPFVAKKNRHEQQQRDMEHVFGGRRLTGELDYVSAWFEKAREFIDGTGVRCALVATNSIVQGEQVPILWRPMMEHGVRIDFAHRTFNWTSEAIGRAAVHVVIVGFSMMGLRPVKVLFDYDNERGDAHELVVEEINPYLVDAPYWIVPSGRRNPVSTTAPRASFGSMPNDGGNLILSDDERERLLAVDPSASNFVRRLIGARQLIRGQQRWCLWLDGVAPAELRKHTLVMQRVEAVRTYREASRRTQTRELAKTPALFGEIRQPKSDYLCLPRHPSQNRRVVPLVFCTSDEIAHDSTITIERATRYDFGVLSSTMFTAWARTVGGRIKSDLRISIENVLNTFPWPDPTPPQRSAIEAASQAVLNVRAAHTASSLADLYDPLATPRELTKAHDELDRAVDAAYRTKSFANELERLSYIFERYASLAGLLDPAATAPGSSVAIAAT